ncbi:hypothetical protein CTAYLR_004670 [Chrysophaeum taylorii]|uniref:Ceramidase n=1 Tax=Chrysophaeum taylorii TaxID=2483200 RepID=A0AAD7U7C3_9STRA|nr:hypothetical protein CTAYLR_004670 [Chrysophaeum taylorii]
MDREEENNLWRTRYDLGKSSVDFCERNFSLTPWVAEPFNAASAAPLIGLGLVGYARCRRATKSRGFAVLFALLVLVGIGTVALHGTLTSAGQAADEVPMLVLTVGLLATIVDVERPRAKGLVTSTCLAAVGLIVWYFRFQHLYLVFLASYGTLVVAIIGLLARLAFVPRSDPARDRVRRQVIKPLFLYGLASYVCAGFVAWCTDMLLCETVSQLFLGGLVLHPLWHLGSGLGSWCAIYAVIAARDERRGQAATRLTWLAGLLPCVDHDELRHHPSDD